MIGVELFSGAGGMSVGASLAGIRTKLAIEIDAHATLTFSRNHKGCIVINEDIRQVKHINVDSGKEQKILFGGPPCQGFSKSNMRTRNASNENNWLFKEYLRIVNLWKPDWIVLENVYGILGTEKGLFIDQILQGFRSSGYTVSYSVLNAQDFQVPQNRERLFIVGSLHNEIFSFPKPRLVEKVTVKEALDDLPSLENGETGGWKPYKKAAEHRYAKELRGRKRKSSNHNVSSNSALVIERYRHIPQGGNWKDIPNELIANTYKDHSRCHTGIYHRLDENKPSVVIGNYRKNMLIHPTEDRGLSVREAARLQSFPDWFEFEGRLGNQQQQVGNAVPPLLAKAVFNEIIKNKD